MRNPSHSSLVIYTAGPGSQTIFHLHDHRKRDQMFIISLWILCGVSPSSSSFLWFSLQGLYCFHLSSDTVHYVNYVEARTRQSLQGGFIWLECEEMGNSFSLASLPRISESWALSSISVSIIFYFGQNVSAPLTRQKSSLTHKSIHDSSLLKSFHDLNLFFFLISLSTVRQKARKIHRKVYVCKDLGPSSPQFKEWKKTSMVFFRKFRWMFPSFLFLRMIAWIEAIASFLLFNTVEVCF